MCQNVISIIYVVIDFSKQQTRMLWVQIPADVEEYFEAYKFTKRVQRTAVMLFLPLTKYNFLRKFPSIKIGNSSAHTPRCFKVCEIMHFGGN